MPKGHTHGMLPLHLFIGSNGEIAGENDEDFWGKNGMFANMSKVLFGY